ncbi:Maltose/maltodextrin import ATP-binding protein MalK [Pleomorphomonas sp. T1.2MG-36]|uniref:ABC transporter ATP-binding protein n=1 Tax=Pleomorphomonas sp. T1.2MG-36 TaxID=3041167 RepID=UPI002477C23A|nr:sn-glycerol-3-phosphate ABC transporter ATP-binding protein UgpC [Pleomorphomonas sp. T1.2MG-36]CAI9418419.1 Maltose/maltodextrin import ATP-binding protein MalK [Pleomorphomonas sp. T1.2MG-36]
MSSIELDSVSKRFGSVEVISELSLTIHSGEFIAFLGPSGCGKSTLLRMIAGLESVDGGEIRIGGERVDHLPPGARGVAMVFQHYALYPHMTVFDNLAFGLRNIGTPENEIARRIEEAARILEIGHLLKRKPGQLSGGQRQRVAIGRALVKDPKAYLFDEPLSNLDAALRVRTRVELARLHQQTRATTIFVTHDQVEAMTLASRIVVMNARKVEQVGTPMDIYGRPATEFVARFVGSPAMNFLPVSISERGGLASAALGDGSIVDTDVPVNTLPAGGALRVGIRAEAIHVRPDGAIPGKVEVVERLGDRTHLHIRLTDGNTLVAEDKGISQVQPGDTVRLAVEGATAHLFDDAGLAYHARQ